MVSHISVLLDQQSVCRRCEARGGMALEQACTIVSGNISLSQCILLRVRKRTHDLQRGRRREKRKGKGEALPESETPLSREAQMSGDGVI